MFIMSKNKIEDDAIRTYWYSLKYEHPITAELAEWLRTQLLGNWTSVNAFYVWNSEQAYYFEYEEDLVAFKLRWL